MDFNDIDNLKECGFEGFISVSDLQMNSCRCDRIPNKRGVYLVLRTTANSPTFLGESTGGHFKGEDPTVAVNVLREKWIEDCLVVNIGKAGRSGGKVSLRSRLQQYMKFGSGKPVGHRGGRYIWQLSDSRDLIVCWKPVENVEPRHLEKRLILEFESMYRRLPFSNLTH